MKRKADTSKTNQSVALPKSSRYGTANTNQSVLSSRDKSPGEDQEIGSKVNLLKKMGLLGGLHLKQVRYDGHIRMPTVYNDYHQASSNPGYSRKPDGGIYPK